MSNQLKRIGDIIGSFVSSDFKRKRLQDDSSCVVEPEESPVKKLKTTGSFENEFVNVPSFMKRVSTFSDFCWSRDIPELSPLEVARHGWMSTKDDFMVKCVSCQEHLSLAIPVPSTGIRESCIKTAIGRLFSAHGEFCAWASTSAPAYLSRIQISDLDEVADTALKIAKLGERLPFIRPDIVEPWSDVLKRIDKGRFENVEDQRIVDFSCVLALCGWQVGDLDDTLVDIYSVRKLGVWNFISIQDQEDIEETRRVAEELGSSLEENRDFRPEGKDYLDPLEEHMIWHPLLQQGDEGEKGWQQLRNQLSGSSAAKRNTDTRKRDSFRFVYKIRDMLDQW